MPVALHPNCISRYVLKADRELPESEQTRFKIRALTTAQYYDFQGEQFAVFKRRSAALKVKTLSQSLEPAEEKDEDIIASIDNLEWTKPYVEFIAKLVNFGLLGWENFKDADGKDVAFEVDSEGVVKPECLMRLSCYHVEEIANAVLSENQAPPELKKN